MTKIINAMCKFLEPGFRSFGASRALRPWSPEAKSRMPCSLNGEGVEDFLKSVFFCETGLQNVVQAVILRVLVPQYGGFMVISSGLGIRGRVPMRRIITWLLSYR